MLESLSNPNDLKHLGRIIIKKPALLASQVLSLYLCSNIWRQKCSPLSSLSPAKYAEHAHSR